ncbi:MAG: HflC protein [SAR116 cluster bacterium]|nr:HflC protein [SAR116 cluster bacterium]RPH08390.1 MAG: protease modulator HflC [Alphaproteobacteria bacterium TMED54]
MSNIKLTIYSLGAIILFFLYSSFFTVDQTKQAMVLQFGEPKRVINKPGLNFKMPFIQDVTYFEKRVLSLVSSDSEEVILSDQKRLEVDTYSRFKIIDPLLFYQTVRNENGARQRLESIIDSSVRRVLGKLELISILSDARQNIVDDIGTEVNQIVKRLGMEIIDVRIRRADYPEATSQNIFNRMRSEREQEAKEFRAQGAEEAQKIRSDAEKQKTILLAEAQRKAEAIRGEGDGEAIKIYADAFGRDKKFFKFYRSMQAYEKTFVDKDTTMILSPESEFFNFFSDKKGN